MPYYRRRRYPTRRYTRRRRRRYVPRRRRFMSRRRLRPSFRRIRRRFPGTQMIGRNIIPQMTIVTLPYVDLRNEILALGNAHRFTQQWRCTSINDPQVAVGGHQPLGHDQWAPLYNRYMVLKCEIAVRVTHTSDAERVTANPPQLIFCLSMIRGGQSTGITGAVIENIMEQPMTQWVQIGEPGAANGQKTLRRTYDAARFWKLDPFSEDRLESGINSDPGHECRFIVTIENKTGGALETSELTVATRLRYTVAYRYPNTLTES